MNTGLLYSDGDWSEYVAGIYTGCQAEYRLAQLSNSLTNVDMSIDACRSEIGYCPLKLDICRLYVNDHAS